MSYNQNPIGSTPDHSDKDGRLVNVLVPIYRPQLSESDRISLTQTCRMLAAYPITVIHPEGMDTSAIGQEFPMLAFRAFNTAYFADIKGYNRLMLASEFYAAFADFKYILIAQLDVFIFRDNLAEWCLRDYDYVGAPWLQRRVYTLPVIAQLLRLYKRITHLRGRLTRFDRYGKVGNGGLSLRKVESHLRVIREQEADVYRFAVTHNREHLHNEDTFWAMMPCDFHYPSEEEAIRFAYDKYPELSFKRSHGTLPFGCHGWTKSKNRVFWCGEGDTPRFPSH